MAQAAYPFGHQGGAITLAVITKRLEAAVSREDLMTTLICTAELDRAARAMGEGATSDADRLALIRARDLVDRSLIALQQVMARNQLEDQQNRRLRAAYGLGR